MASRYDLVLARVRREKLPTLQIEAARLKEPDLAGLCEEAVVAYARVRPRRVSAVLPGDAYDFVLPDGILYSTASAWVQGFSAIDVVEFPAGQREPVYLQDDAWALWPREGATHLRLLFDTPSAGQTVRLFYRVPHTFTPALSTIPVPDEEILVNLLARLACLSCAAAVAEAKDAIIAGDAVQYRDMQARFESLAKRYTELLPVEFRRTDAQVTQPASGIVDWDLRGAFGYPFVWHGGRSR